MAKAANNKGKKDDKKKDAKASKTAKAPAKSVKPAAKAAKPAAKPAKAPVKPAAKAPKPVAKPAAKSNTKAPAKPAAKAMKPAAKPVVKATKPAAKPAAKAAPAKAAPAKAAPAKAAPAKADPTKAAKPAVVAKPATAAKPAAPGKPAAPAKAVAPAASKAPAKAEPAKPEAKKVDVVKKPEPRKLPAIKPIDPLEPPANPNALIHGQKPYIAKAGEDYMSDGQLEHFRKILLAWKQELMEEVDRTVHHMQDESSNLPDPNDRATQEEEFALELRTRDRERKLIKKIDKTMTIIEDGDYGYCQACGIEIGIRRLEARPTAELCIDCKTLAEIKEKQVGSGG